MDMEQRVEELEKRMAALEGVVQGLRRSSCIISVSVFVIAITLITFSHRQQQMTLLLDKTNQALDKTFQILVQ